MCVFIPRLRARWSSSHQHSEQVLSLTAAFVLLRLFTGLRQTSSSEVRNRTQFTKPTRCIQTEFSPTDALLDPTEFLVVFFSPDSDLPLSSHRNSSSRERSDRFDRSDRGSDRFDRRDERRDDRDRNRLQVTKRSFSRENEERSREREQRGSADPVRRVASMTDDRDRGSRERARSKENGRWRDIAVVWI